MLSKNYVNVLLLGISGMDYKITKGLLAAGRLPSFKKLADQGSFIKLDASLPAENNLAWISLLTGLNPGKHNCFDAVNRNPLTYGLELVSVKNNNEAFRNKLIDQLISHAGLSASAPGLSFLDHFDSEGNNPGGQELIKQIADLEKTQEDWFWKEFFQFKEKGLMYFIFNALNQLQQTFWNNPAIGREEGKIKLNKAVVDYYEQKDRLLQQVLDKLDSPTALLIVSNRGVNSFERSFHLNNWLVENEFMQLTPNLSSAREPLFKHVDWDTTRAYAIGFSSLYLNLEHREGKGIVTDKELLLKELMPKLELIADPNTGERIIHKIYRKEEVYSGSYLNNAPDLIITLKPGYQMSWQTAVGGFGGQIIEDNSQGLSGNHLVDPSFIPGILFSNQKLGKISAQGLDVAPTILELLGLEIPPEMDGKSLLK
ncbi:alkaline phosphatase family protein [Candidatus Woesearchaeota archaeon]|nr:alkaline phosphatase family protein [Candidatus Woesearchaeota archaeon]